MEYNSRGFLGFSVNHKTENSDNSVSADDIRKAIIKRLADLTDEDLIQCVELDDTVEIGLAYCRGLFSNQEGD